MKVSPFKPGLRTPLRRLLPLYRLLPLFLSAFILFVIALGFVRQSKPVQASSVAQPTLTNPDATCAHCHAAIVTSYRKTSMAQGSGLATTALDLGSFTQTSSGVTYKVANRDNPHLHATRENDQAPLDDTEQLAYFIGSGKHGRTYLFSRTNGDEKLWYEAPINWYTRRSAYGMAPAFDRTPTAPLALQTDANCLHCHASAVQQPLAGAVNAFKDQPFQQAGIGCSSCHGDTAEHVRTNGKAPMLKLAALAPPKRESICLQCHLEGDAMVQRTGRTLSTFVPGQDLADTAVYFVNAASPKSAARASSQYEGMLRSSCFRAVGDKLTCTTCHDPHSNPAPVERVAFYRAKCLQCHSASPGFQPATHHAEQPDCASCHMTSRPTSDISHEQNVDHDIEAMPRSLVTQQSTHPALELHSLDAPATPVRYTRAVDLVPVGGAQPTPRERGLAYAQFALHGDRDSYGEALSLLHQTEQAGNADSAVHEQLGYLAQIANSAKTARTEYEAALAQNPQSSTALSNLAVLEAQSGDTPSAIRHLSILAAGDPGQTAALLNLALLECRANDGAAAKTTLKRALAYNPDSAEARTFLATGNYGSNHCAVH